MEVRDQLNRIERKIDECREDSSHCRRILDGPPGKPQEGLVFQQKWTDRTVRRATKLFWAALAAFVAAIASAVANLTHGKHTP